MAVIGGTVATLVDVAKRLDPNGKIARIAEVLAASNNGVLDDMLWKEGNLVTGDRTAVRTGLPSVAFRRLNEGVPRSKSTVAQVDEGAAFLEGFSEVDRAIAVLSGDVSQYRLSESEAFFEAMRQRQATNVFYGNATTSPREYTGLAPRYNSLSGVTGPNIIDAGGSGSTNRSIWLVVWGENTIRGIYPKGTKAGLFHEDATANKTPSDDGYPVGDVLYDASGNPYMGYRDHYQWNSGLSVKDWRYAVRIANIDYTTLTKNAGSGADLIDLMVQALELIQDTGMSGTRAAFYAPRNVRAYLRRQIGNKSNVWLSPGEVGGKKVMVFGDEGIPVRRVDALNVNEARVV